MPCAICKLRKPKRDCPAVGGAICSVCCGTEREETLNCPLDCKYLQQAHQYETEPDVNIQIPNLDIELPESFLEETEFIIMLFTAPIAYVAVEEPAITDYDMREAFEALVKTWRTLESGLVFDHVPANPYAARIYDTIRGELDTLRLRAREADPEADITDKQMLGILVFLQRTEYSWNNGRRKSRAFIDLITRPFRESLEHAGEGLVEPDEPLIIL